MSAESTSQIRAYDGTEPTLRYSEYADVNRGIGWVLFAGTMIGLVGVLNLIEGIAAIGNSHFYTHNAHYVFGDLNTWGWIVLVIGVVEMFVGVGIWVRNQFARWVGVIGAMLNAIAQLLFIPAYPFWSLSLFALSILVIYGLIAHGGRASNRAA